MYYERAGEGPPLLFFNGSGATLESSAPLIEQFRRHFDVVAHDQRGLGRTTIPAEPFTMAQYAADGAALLDHIGWDRCAVVGVSFGGMVAQEFAVTCPERITRLALLCTSPGGAELSSYPLHELVTRPAAEQAAIGMTLLDTRFTPEWLTAHPLDRAIIEARCSVGGSTAVGRATARRARPAAGPQRARRGRPAAPADVPYPRSRRALRRHRTTGQQRGDRAQHPGRRAAAVRRRPPLLHPGPRRVA